MHRLKRGMAAIRQVVVEGELGGSRLQRKIHSVVARLTWHGCRGNDDGKLSGSRSQDGIQLGIWRQRGLKGVLVGLSQGRE